MLVVRSRFSVGIALCLAPVLWASACGGDDESPAQPSPEGGAGSGSGARTGSGGSSAGGGPGATGGSISTGGAPPVTCDMTPCEGRVIQEGVTLPTCCIDAQTCGLGPQGLCLPVSAYDDLTRDGGPLPPGETVVLDPTCPDQVLSQGTLTFTFPGCCDKGLCGAALAQGSPFAQCLTPEDARAAGAADAGASIPCGSRPTPDAGTGGTGPVPDGGPSRGDGG